MTVYDECLDKTLVSYRGLQRSARILRLIVTHYFPAYGLGLEDYFACHPVLSFFGALVYQTDEQMETLQASQSPAEMTSLGLDTRYTVVTFLEALELLSPDLKKELHAANAYMELETRLLGANRISHQELRHALELRSSDLRAMHRLFLAVLERPADELLFRLYFPMEVMAEIRDDLYQYEEDRATGNFNSYVMLQKLYSDQAARYLIQERDHYHRIYIDALATASNELQGRLAPIAEEAFALSTLPCPEHFG